MLASPLARLSLPARMVVQSDDSQTLWRSQHHGSERTVGRLNTADWLNGASTAPMMLPTRFNIISGLPDVSEVRPRLSAAEYEAWCVGVVRRLIELTPPDQVAIFYQTPGRFSGEGGAWLDKAFFCTTGARGAGAACVWQKVVLIQDSVGRRRGGRPGFVNLLCYSRRHRVPRGFTTVDVLPDRGHMSYHNAIGEEACCDAIDYCRRYVDGEDRVPIFDPFCGVGSVLAVANALGHDSFGMDLNLKCCRAANEHECSDGLIAHSI